MLHSDPIRDFYERCNRTELYQSCMRIGLIISPAEPREKLVSYLLGTETPPPVEHPLHVWRNGLIGLIQDYWTGIEAQLRCPAKELSPPAKEGEPPKPDPSDIKSPLACYRCADTRVIACLVDNAPHEELIQLHRKMTIKNTGENDMTSIGSLTLETAPRSMEGMSQGTGVDRGTLMRLYNKLVETGALSNKEQDKVAFVEAPLDGRRQIVVQGLQIWDQMNNRTQGAAVAAPAATEAPTPTPVVSGPSTVSEPPRTPTVRGKRAATPMTPSTPAGEPMADDDVRWARIQAERLNVALESIASIKEGLGGFRAALDAFDGHVDNNGARHAELLGAIRSLEETVKLQAAIALWQIDQAGQVAPADVMKEAKTYIQVFDRGLLALGKGS